MSRQAFGRALLAGETGISRVRSFDTERIGRHYAGEVHDFDAAAALTREEATRLDRCSAMAVAAARQAVTEARLTSLAQAAVVMGTTMGDAVLLSDLEATWVNHGLTSVKPVDVKRYSCSRLATEVARSVGARAATLTLNAACAAGNYALGIARDLIARGKAEVVVVGASEVVAPLQYAGFVRLAAMAHEMCCPFDANRQGIILGEGAAVFVLESEAHAEARGATPLAELGGWGLSCDAYHVTRPHPEATGSIDAMRDAIARSNIDPTAVDFVNAHGTGTKHNDLAEAIVMREVFGGRRVPITSNKSALGHCMGAASALEGVSCLVTLETQMIPPTLNYETPDPACDVDVVANVARPARVDIALNNALAFGGYNAVTCFARPGVLPAPGPTSAHGARP
jgi:3-oxoacyl-[acyl-carrier-protein] synthase II